MSLTIGSKVYPTDARTMMPAVGCVWSVTRFYPNDDGQRCAVLVNILGDECAVTVRTLHLAFKDA